MSKIIGIDLGTTNSCAAIVEGGHPKVIPSAKGYLTVPSVVTFDKDGLLLVGLPAVRQSLINPEDTVYGAKRLIGRRFDSQIVTQIKKSFHYEIYETENNEAGIKIKGRKFTLPEIMSLILKEIKRWAEEYLGEEVPKAVITVPAYFNDRQRQAVRKAGQLAGFEVPRMINEPTAAALAYGFGKGLDQKILVYDLGGGTFDVSILDISEGMYRVLSTHGDTFLGGVDFDNRIVEYALEVFEKETKVDLMADRVAMQRLKDASEAAKKELSIREEVMLNVPYIFSDSKGAKDLNVPLTRKMLEQMVFALVDKTIRIVKDTIAMAGIKLEDIDTAILVGGQTRMPLIWKKMYEFFSKPPSKGVHPDEVVASGAAIMSDILSRGGASDLLLVDVVPLSFGLVLPNGKFKKIIARNVPMPAKKSKMFTTYQDNQSSVKISVAQGESDLAADNELLQTISLKGIPPMPKGEPKIEVTFTIDADGILQVSAKDKQTGAKIKTVVQSGDDDD